MERKMFTGRRYFWHIFLKNPEKIDLPKVVFFDDRISKAPKFENYEFQKPLFLRVTKFGAFRPIRTDCARLRDHLMKMWGWRFTIINCSNIRWSVSLAKSAFKVKNREICVSRAFDFLNCETKFDLPYIPSSFNDRKTTPDVLTLSASFYDLPVSRNLFSKAELRQFGSSGTVGLT